MSVYLDTSVLVPLFIQEAGTSAARAGVAAQAVMVSEFAMTEFSAAVARRARMGEISAEQALAIFADCDAWVTRTTQVIPLEAHDVAAATALVRRLELGLRAPDALHLAICERLGATLFTFDAKMMAAAQALGIVIQT